MKLKGSKTEKNLMASFAGESQARTRYAYFSSVAKKEGYEQISAIFAETAENEKEHAKLFFKALEGGDVEITASYPAGMIKSTEENLKASADGEKHEWTVLYPEAADVADSEGFPEIAKIFRNVARAEVAHETRYRKLLDAMTTKKTFERAPGTKWKCRNCGYVHDGASAPDKCPVCDHPQAYFEIFTENY